MAHVSPSTKDDIGGFMSDLAEPLTEVSEPQLVHTFSIVARDPQTGQMGVAVQSHYFSVGTVVPLVEAGVSAVATQAFSDGSSFSMRPSPDSIRATGDKDPSLIRRADSATVSSNSSGMAGLLSTPIHRGTR